jgi:hypothetical protein
MHKRLWTGAFAAITCAAAVALMAQGTGSSASETRSSSDKITVTGCLQSADQATAGTTGTPSGSSSTSSMSDRSAKFLLIPSKSDSSGSASATGTTGTSAAAAPKASSYRLDGDDSKLSPHVGHKVAITGTLESAAASGSGASSTGSTGGASSYSSSSAGSTAPKLKVDSVTMIAPSCSE